MDEKTFNLTWNNHLANLSGLFEGLYRSGSLTDATLACQGGMLRAHKLVLAACSPYFERVFKEHYGDQPIIILRGVPVEELECLLDFMYRGSIDVAEEHLPSLIKTATDLEIRGLSTDHKTDGMYYPSHSMNTSNSQNKLPRCHIEAKVNTSPELQNDKTTSSGSGLSCSGGGNGSSSGSTSNNSCQRQLKTENTRVQEIEDDPMIIHRDRDFETSIRTPEEQIRHIPPPMYKRETRYKGQKRVPIGRGSLKTNDILDIKIKDCVSLKDTPAEELFNDEMSSLTTVKEEPNFRGSSDPTVPAIQIDDDMYDHDQDSDNLELTTATSLEAQTNTPSSMKKSDVVNKRVTSKAHKAQYKPFSCDLCTLAFTRASHLARHRRVHTGERPFACTLCPRMFARQDKLKQHLDSHLQWPKRRALGSNTTGLSIVGSEGSYAPTKGKRGRPRKIPTEHSAMEEVLKFGEFSSLLNKSQHNDQNSNSDAITCVKEENSLDKDIDCSYGCQVENGHDVQ